MPDITKSLRKLEDWRESRELDRRALGLLQRGYGIAQAYKVAMDERDARRAQSLLKSSVPLDGKSNENDDELLF
jgi:hypothetical protein